MKILITGKDSYIGTSFEKWVEQYSPEWEIDTVDTKGETWKKLNFNAYDTVIHVAGIAHVSTDPKMEELYYKVNRDLALEVARKAKADGAKQIIFMSSMILYGADEGVGITNVITRETEPKALNFYGDSKVQAENGIRKLEDDHSKIVILRPPMIYGKGSKGNYPTLAKIALKLPVFPYMKNERSMLYIENLCEFIRLMVVNNESGTFHPQNAEYSNTSELVKTIGQAHGKKVRLIKGFSWVLKLMSTCTNLVNKAFGNLSYDMELSQYKIPYVKYDLKSSIDRTER